MFESDSRLRYLLSPQHYFCERHFALERQVAFDPGWHFIGSRSELSRDGDFLTTDLFEVPILVRNFDGNLRAFRNVCPHRHAMLTNQPSGNTAVLKCQYHGWEFASDGSTGRIPEAKCFRPWDRENSHLDAIRLETCGDLIFVSLNQDAQPLLNFLAPFVNDYQHCFDGDLWQMKHIWEFETAANWKVPAENSLDSYHVTEVHPKWFGDQLPSEASTHHDLTERYTALTYESTMATEYRQATVKRILGGQPMLQYHHRHHYPNLVCCFMDMMSYVVAFQPTSPTTCRVKMRFYAYRGIKRWWWHRLIAEITWRVAKRIALGILREDQQIYPDQQRGLQASHFPGVIGAREERIHHFQRSLLTQLGIDVD